MAGDWIKMRADLQTHPKVVRIASALNADRLRAVGGLHAVWCLFDAHSIDGSLEGYTPSALDDLIGWPGFSVAMSAVGWLEVGKDVLALPRFDEHNGKSAKRRATETERKRAARAATTDPQDDREVSASDADKKRPREEKRRGKVSEPTVPHPPAGGLAAGFDDFWLAWPKGERKQDKAKCLDYWKRNHLADIAETILADVRQKRGTRKWTDGFIEAPLRYLHGKRWEDGTEAERSHPTAGTPAGPDAAAWTESRATVELRGEQMGLGRWDEQSNQQGVGEPWKAYKARVLAAIEASARCT